MKRSYTIQKIILTTYNGRKISLNNIEIGIINTPINLVKEKILDAFSTMNDNPVKVNIKVKYI